MPKEKAGKRMEMGMEESSRKRAKEWSKGYPHEEEDGPELSFVEKVASLAVELVPAPGVFTSEGCPVVW